MCIGSDVTKEANDYAPTFYPGLHPVLYHYCSTATFLSIIQRKCLWLSDVNTMNDFGEVHWAYDRFIEAANLVLAEVGQDFLDKVDLAISTTQLRILPMLCAFSTDGDVLSQWRAYADDGAGVAVGFNASKVASLAVRIAPIEYASERQVHHFRTWLLATHEVHQELPERERQTFLFEMCSRFATDMALYKNPAFSEEQEVRIIRGVVVKADDNDQWELVDQGGSGERNSKKKLPVMFRAARNGGVVSYIEVPLNGLGPNAISEVIVGPKSPNNGREISMALNSAGFPNVNIRRSMATYR